MPKKIRQGLYFAIAYVCVYLCYRNFVWTRMDDEYGSHEFSACYLNPAWGSRNMDSTCVGKDPSHPYSSANHLICPKTYSAGMMTHDDDQRHLDKRSSSSFKKMPMMTIVLLYYAEPALLLKQIEHFETTYPPKILEKIQILIVDDGSPPGLQAQEYVSKERRDKLGVRIVRIRINKIWNQPGARNLAMHILTQEMTEAKQRDHLVVLLDLDLILRHEYVPFMLEFPIRGSSFGSALAHQFNRSKPDGTYKVHPSAMLIHPHAWWNAGGMDEDFVGNYGSEDTAFWYRFQKNLPNKIHHHPRAILEQQAHINPCDKQYIQSPSTNNDTAITKDLLKKCNHARAELTQKQEAISGWSRNANLNKVKLKKKIETGCWSNAFLRFPWILLD